MSIVRRRARRMLDENMAEPEAESEGNLPPGRAPVVGIPWLLHLQIKAGVRKYL